MTFEQAREADTETIVTYILEHASDMAALTSHEILSWLNKVFPGISAGTASLTMEEAVRRLLTHDADELLRLADAEAATGVFDRVRSKDDSRIAAVLAGHAVIANVSVRSPDRDLVEWSKDRDLLVYIGHAGRWHPWPPSIWANPFG